MTVIFKSKSRLSMKVYSHPTAAVEIVMNKIFNELMTSRNEIKTRYTFYAEPHSTTT